MLISDIVEEAYLESKVIEYKGIIEEKCYYQIGRIGSAAGV